MTSFADNVLLFGLAASVLTGGTTDPLTQDASDMPGLVSRFADID